MPVYVADYLDRRLQFQHNGLIVENMPSRGDDFCELFLGEVDWSTLGLENPIDDTGYIYLSVFPNSSVS